LLVASRLVFALNAWVAQNTYNRIDLGIASNPTFHCGGLFEYM
jgi:hypothetical protein